MKSAVMSLALITGLACCPALAADVGKAGTARQAAPARSPEARHAGLIDGRIRLRPEPLFDLAKAGTPTSALPLAATTRPPAPGRGNPPGRPDNTTAEQGVLPFVAAALGVLAFLIVRLRRGA